MQTLKTVSYLVARVLIGRFLPLGRPWFARFVAVTFGLMVTYTVAAAVVFGEVFVFDTPLFAPGDSVASCQGTARSVFVIALMALALARS